jgi:hypothetical protein
MKQNITLRLEKSLIKKGKIVAAQRDTSISKMLGEQLKLLVEDEERYQTAKRSALRALKKGYHLGGKVTWRREDIYDR